MAPKRTPLATRLFRKLVSSETIRGCWLWTGNLNSEGYGRIRLPGGGPQVYTHRVMYELCYGPIPDDLTIDHLCHVRNCCNPFHLAAVSRGENVLRGFGIGANNARKAACHNGHPFDEANTYRWRGVRQCRACRRAADKRRVR